MTDNLPPHFRPLVADLETIIELRAIAREAAAFLIALKWADSSHRCTSTHEAGS